MVDFISSFSFLYCVMRLLHSFANTPRERERNNSALTKKECDYKWPSYSIVVFSLQAAALPANSSDHFVPPRVILCLVLHIFLRFGSFSLSFQSHFDNSSLRLQLQHLFRRHRRHRCVHSFVCVVLFFNDDVACNQLISRLLLYVRPCIGSRQEMC